MGALLVEFCSPALDVLRWRDVKALVQPDHEEIRVQVLVRGQGPLVATVQVVPCWTGQGWSRSLLCPGCGLPVAVLRAVAGHLLCNRCSGRPTAERLQHRTRAWREGGKLAEQLIDVAGRRGSLEHLEELAEEVARGDLVRIEALSRLPDLYELDEADNGRGGGAGAHGRAR